MEKVFLGVLAGETDPAVIKAVRGVLIFIYYAHFETHTDESLALLDAAWKTFHDNKNIFEELEIRRRFNISKLHNVKHYFDSIRSRGTTDGFNTESSERLHIDLAKMGYNASNKKSYIRQMTVWLRRQEAIRRFHAYLQWAVPGYLAKVAKERNDKDDDCMEAEDDEDEDDDDDDEDDKTAAPTSPSMNIPAYVVAKTPGYPKVTVTSIMSDFSAPDFLPHLDQFLRSNSIPQPTTPTPNSVFSLYKRLTLELPAVAAVSSYEVKDVVRAAKPEAAAIISKGIKKATAGYFSTVLIRIHPQDKKKGPIDGT